MLSFLVKLNPPSHLFFKRRPVLFFSGILTHSSYPTNWPATVDEAGSGTGRQYDSSAYTFSQATMEGGNEGICYPAIFGSKGIERKYLTHE